MTQAKALPEGDGMNNTIKHKIFIPVRTSFIPAWRSFVVLVREYSLMITLYCHVLQTQHVLFSPRSLHRFYGPLTPIVAFVDRLSTTTRTYISHAETHPFYTIHMSRIGVAALLLLLGSVVTSATSFGQICERLPVSCSSSGCPEIGCTQAGSSPCPLGIATPIGATQVGNPTDSSATCSCHHIDNPTPPCVQMHLSLR